MKMTIYVCADEDQAGAAVLVLQAHGYQESDISIEAVSAVNYDAKTYANGAKDQFMTPQWVVIGRK